MVRALASHARGRRFESYCLYHRGYVCGRNRKENTMTVFSFSLCSDESYCLYQFCCSFLITLLHYLEGAENYYAHDC